LNLTYRHWLPDDAIVPEAVRDPIARAVAQWNARWFVGDYACVAGLKSSSGAARNETDDTGWRVYRTAVAIRSKTAAPTCMTDRAVDMETSGLHLSEGDHMLLKALGQHMIADLAETIEVAFGLAGETASELRLVRDPLADGGGMLCILTDPSGREILGLAIPSHVVALHVKSTLGASVPRAEAVQSPVEALVRVPLLIEAVIGSAELNLAELADLSVGDVLVLDRAIDAPVEVAIADTHRIFARAQLIQIDDEMALEFKV